MSNATQTRSPAVRTDRPFDHRAALDAYLDLLGRHADEYAFFADRIHQGHVDLNDVYINWLMLPRLELERRGKRRCRWTG